VRTRAVLAEVWWLLARKSAAPADHFVDDGEVASFVGRGVDFGDEGGGSGVEVGVDGRLRSVADRPHFGHRNHRCLTEELETVPT
jgi:hypothetical protein